MAEAAVRTHLDSQGGKTVNKQGHHGILAMLRCLICGSEIPDVEEKCSTCGAYAGPPNVRAAGRQEESDALAQRYRAAIERATKGGYLPILHRFESAVQQSFAVINCDSRFLHFFITSGKSLYSNYEGGVEGRIRKPATFYDDLRRRGVAGTLFGGYATDIIYAALSLDGNGPTSYGPYAIRLKDIAIRNRATVLENNSYVFVRIHNIVAGDRSPLGFFAPWELRHKLAVAKVGEHITPDTKDTDFPQLLLSGTGTRTTDEFIEVHIYDTFDLNAIESIRGNSNAGSREDRDLLSLTKQHLIDAGISWIET